MSLIEPRSVTSQASRAERALQFPVGVVSPLWLLYAGAASAGMAYWWLTRWAKPSNLEALLGAGKAAATAAVEAAAPAAEAVLVATEVAEESLEAVVEEVHEIERFAEASPPVEVISAEPTVVEAAPEPVAPEPVAAKTVKVIEPTEILEPLKPKAPRRPRSTAKPRVRS
jgi:hypothetical protein